jgi:molybdopterin converting factor small subunit
VDTKTTMRVLVRYSAPLSICTNSIREDVKLQVGSTIAELIDVLCLLHGPQFSAMLVNQQSDELNVSVLVNGRGENSTYKLKDGDEVAFIVFMCGG